MSEEIKNSGVGGEPNNFGVPNDYFKTSAAKLFSKLAWAEEHKGFPRLAELRKYDLFVTPDSYFVESEKNLELVPFENLRKIERVNNFSSPAGYFDRNSHQLEEKVNLPFLKSIPKQNVFQVERNYFELNKKALEKKLEVKQKAHVIDLFRKRILYPAAAILIVTLSMVFYNNYFSVAPVEDCGTIACLDKADLVKGSNLENFDDYELYEIVNTSVLEEKLGAESPAKKKEKTEIDSNDFSTEDLLDEI